MMNPITALELENAHLRAALETATKERDSAREAMATWAGKADKLEREVKFLLEKKAAHKKEITELIGTVERTRKVCEAAVAMDMMMHAYEAFEAAVREYRKATEGD